MKILNRILKYALSRHQGKLKYQTTFQYLYHLGLSGMNMGGGWDIEDSGEGIAIEHVKSLFSRKNHLMLFDVGANKGDYSTMLKKLFQEKATIHAFEPSKHTFVMLQKKVGNQDRVFLHQKALGETAAQLTLYYPEKGAGLASLYDRKLDHFGIETKEAEQVAVVTLDSFCQENGISEIDFLKLDVEGHELAVLKGGKQMLDDGKIHVIQFEFGGCNIDSRTYFQDFFYLLSPGFRIYRIVKDGLFPIEEYSEDLEVFKTTNYLCISKKIVADQIKK
ncbi:FkbM family methyltransferase [Algoriphagus boritolerans]|uniref:Methyltransferase, FkbM family n=2 Tax=Algoriphagus TaxID=246875 RepID=A0A1H6A695_9BACT|nr:FkbM family methyltransferase [Algoriphagus boritolerans]SEG43981.1 methyltransferase, FkbM family [Algoriphagus boritolerans DSM 17298 = JCM 18970]